MSVTMLNNFSNAIAQFPYDKVKLVHFFPASLLCCLPPFLNYFFPASIISHIYCTCVVPPSSFLLIEVYQL